jgi:putative hydrolase
MLYDFHTHTFLSDGVLLAIELIRRAEVNGYTAIGVTDHVSASNVESVVKALVADCRLAERHWEIRALPGVELTHLPPEAISELAAAARGYGAQLVVVHGETPVEPVAPGTNRAAAACADVDVLAHPGLLEPAVAALAAQHGVFVEISSHYGHCLGNGAVLAAARATGARLLVNSDSHTPKDLHTPEFVARVARGAGMGEEEATAALQTNAQELLARALSRRTATNW